MKTNDFEELFTPFWNEHRNCWCFGKNKLSFIDVTITFAYPKEYGSMVDRFYENFIEACKYEMFSTFASIWFLKTAELYELSYKSKMFKETYDQVIEEGKLNGVDENKTRMKAIKQAERAYEFASVTFWSTITKRMND